MYKLIIVDDEKIIREGIGNFIEKQNIDFEIVGKFSNGYDAVKYIENHSVDVVLTDIKMPKISGLELAKIIYEKKPKIKVVIISGFKEFEYAKKAMEYGVKHYLLKPTDLNEIREVFGKIRIELDYASKEYYNKSVYNNEMQWTKEEYLMNIILSPQKDSSIIEKRFKLLGINKQPLNMPCCIFKIRLYEFDKFLKEIWQHGKDGFQNAFQNLLSEMNHSIEFYEMYQKNDLICILALGSERDNFKDKLQKEIWQIKENLISILKVDSEINIISFYENIGGIDAKDILPKNEDEELILDEKVKIIMSHISSKAYEEAYEMGKLLFNEMDTIPIEYLHGVTLNLITKITESFQELQTLKHKYSAETILKVQNCSEMRKLFENYINDIIHISNNENTYEKSVIVKAKQFIDKNYNRDISLQDVADSLFLSPMYFSRFFKEKTGQSFTDYLIQTRMNHAIRLLKQKMKIEEISNQTGYSSSRYFVRMFKQYTGYTPKEYYRQIINMENNI